MYVGVLALIVFWIALTIIGQVSIKSLTRMRKWDPFGLLPSWHFFAPNPARFDTVVLVREAAKAGESQGDWEVVAGFYDERWWHAIFNPQRRIQKSMHDLQNAIGNMADKFATENVCRSAPVSALIRYVESRAGSRGLPHDHQYAIARIERARTAPKARVVFVTSVFPKSV